MEFNSAVLTRKGIELLARVQAEDNLEMRFTRAVTGNGEYTESEDLTQRTALKSQKQEFQLSRKGIINQATVYLKWIITNLQEDAGPLLNGYYVQEAGLYATVLDENGNPDPEQEVLYAIATAATGRADWLPAYNELIPSTITVDFYVEVANAEHVTITAGAGAYATAEDLEALKEKVDALELTAMAVTYDHTGSALPAENVQDAVDALAGTLDNVQGNLMATQVAVVLLQEAAIAGLSQNLLIEAFLNGADVRLLDGQYDPTAHRLYA